MSRLETGEPTMKYIYSKPPDIFKLKFVAIRYALSQKSLAFCLFFSIFCIMPQMFIMAIFRYISDVGFGYMHIFSIFIFDWLTFFCCIMAMISIHLSDIEEAINNMKLNNYMQKSRDELDSNREEAKEKIKDLMLEVMIARKSTEHRQKTINNKKNTNLD